MGSGIWQIQLAKSLDSFGPAVFDYLWFAGGAVGLLAWFWLANRVFRWALGYRKLGGRWVSATEYRTILGLPNDDAQMGGDPGAQRSAFRVTQRRDHVPYGNLPPANRHFG
jgi:hypothetical protein